MGLLNWLYKVRLPITLLPSSVSKPSKLTIKFPILENPVCLLTPGEGSIPWLVSWVLVKANIFLYCPSPVLYFEVLFSDDLIKVVFPIPPTELGPPA